MTRDINTIKQEIVEVVKKLSSEMLTDEYWKLFHKVKDLSHELKCAEDDLEQSSRLKAEPEPDMSAGPIDKAQYDTYHYRIDLITRDCLFVSDIEGPFQRGGEWFYHVTLWCDDRNTDDWRDSISLNARHIVAVFDAKS